MKMLVFEVEKENVDYVMGFFEDCKEKIGIIETHRFSGSSEMIQIAVMISAMTAAGILRLVREIRNCDCNIRITGEEKKLKPEQVTEEYLQEHIRNGNE